MPGGDHRYDPGDFNLLTAVGQLRGEFCSLEFWCFTLIHMCLLAIHEYLPDEWDAYGLQLDWKATTAVTSLLTFFIVFYGTQCYARFQKYYTHCVGMGGVCQEWTALVSLTIPDDGARRWNAVRLILASMHILLYSLDTNKDPKDPCEITFEEWKRMVERELLTWDEVRAVREYEGYMAFLPVIWALAEVCARLAACPAIECASPHAVELIGGSRGGCTCSLCVWPSLLICIWRSLLICIWRSLLICIWPSLLICIWPSLLISRPSQVDEGLKADLAAKSHDKLGENLRATQTLDAFRELGFAFRGHCGQITNWLKEPVPLPYFCFL
jgi:hypothetical protein